MYIKNGIYIICIIAVIFTASSCFSAKEQYPDSRIYLNGLWKISCDDNRLYSGYGYNDSGWDSITLPGSLVPYAERKTGKNSGIVWLRKSFKIPQKNISDMGITFERIANADETYLNGVRIGNTGKFPPREFSMWNHPRQYFIPGNLLRQDGENTIAVRISYNITGGVTDNIFLSNYEQWDNEKAGIRFALVTQMYLVISGGIIFLFIFMLFYIFRRQDEFLYYSLQMIFGLIIIFDLCTYWDIFPSIYTRFKVIAISWVGLDTVHPFFLHRIYNFKRRKTETALKLFFITWVVLILVAGEIKPILFATIFIASCTLLGFYHISCHIYALYRKITLSRIFSLFGLITIVSAMHDGVVYLSWFSGISISIHGYTFNRMIFHYGGFIFFTGTALILVYRFLVLTDEIDDLNRTLENYIINNALIKKTSTGKQEYSNPVSKETEQKIIQVIEYINKNYYDNLSREGLAASVNMHPDNLSKHFNAYSKIRIGDYINKLRILDAAEKLKTTDENVLNIAYSVGFESLRTFNRAFSKHIGTTPERYRNYRSH